MRRGDVRRGGATPGRRRLECANRAREAGESYRIFDCVRVRVVLRRLDDAQRLGRGAKQRKAHRETHSGRVPSRARVEQGDEHHGRQKNTPRRPTSDTSRPPRARRPSGGGWRHAREAPTRECGGSPPPRQPKKARANVCGLRTFLTAVERLGPPEARESPERAARAWRREGGRRVSPSFAAPSVPVRSSRATLPFVHRSLRSARVRGPPADRPPRPRDARDVDQAREHGDPPPSRAVRPVRVPPRPSFPHRRRGVPPRGRRPGGRARPTPPLQPLRAGDPRRRPLALRHLPPRQQRQPMRRHRRRPPPPPSRHLGLRPRPRRQRHLRRRARHPRRPRDARRRRRRRAPPPGGARRSRGHMGTVHGRGHGTPVREPRPFHRGHRARFPVQLPHRAHVRARRRLLLRLVHRRAARGDAIGARLDAKLHQSARRVRHTRPGRASNGGDDALPRVVRARRRRRFHQTRAFASASRHVCRGEGVPRLRRRPQLAEADALLRRHARLLHQSDVPGSGRSGRGRGWRVGDGRGVARGVRGYANAIATTAGRRRRRARRRGRTARTLPRVLRRRPRGKPDRTRGDSRAGRLGVAPSADVRAREARSSRRDGFRRPRRRRRARTK